MKSILDILMDRDGMSSVDAKDLIVAAKEELETRIENGDTEFAYQVCQEFFGLEPDYLMELLN